MANAGRCSGLLDLEAAPPDAVALEPVDFSIVDRARRVADERAPFEFPLV